MGQKLVGAHVVGVLREGESLAALLAGARDAALCVDDDTGLLDEAVANERRDREQSGCRIAAGAGDDGPRGRCAEELRQPVVGALQPGGRSVFEAVPPWVRRGV